MAKFKYRLDNILNLKLMLEEQEKAAFAVCAAKEAEEREKLTKLILRRAGYEKRLAQAMDSHSIDRKEIIFLRNAEATMRTLIRDQMFALKKAQNALEVERAKLREARKERKTHERLKEKAFDEFKHEVIAGENKENDELTSYRYGSAARMTDTRS